jgi:glutamine synthetase
VIPTSRPCRISRASRLCPGSRLSRASPATSTWTAKSGPTTRVHPPPPDREGPHEGIRLPHGLELEYFLVELRDDGSIALADALDTLEKPCYDLNGLSRHYDFLTTVSRYVNEPRLGQLRERPRGRERQFEQNFTYADALTSCDRAIFFRYMVHQLAERRARRGPNHLATFMPKPFTQPDRKRLPLPHVALGRRHEPLPRRERPRGLGLSDTAYRFIAGLKKHAKATAL